jgi:hypothetical protein
VRTVAAGGHARRALNMLVTGGGNGGAGSAHHFAWKVSPFVAMTIGSYLLGSAWMAGVVQHTWTFARVYTLLLYLWLFGVLETVVVISHRDKLAAGPR